MEKTITLENLWKLFQETDRMQKENERERKENARERKERERILDEKFAKTEAFLNSVGQQLGSIGNSNGAMAEEYFFNSFRKNLEFAHKHFDFIEKNVLKADKKIKDEYDIVLYNDTSIAIIEVKYKASEADIPKTLNKLATFRLLSPMYKNHTLYLGLASFSFTEAVEKSALAAGIAVIKQVGDHVVVLDENIKQF